MSHEGKTMNLFHRCSCSGSSDDMIATPKTTSVFMSQEAFSDLPEDEKNHVYTELYGTDDAIEESDEFIAAKLRHLENLLDRIKPSKKENHCLALEQEEIQETNYVRSKAFRLMFLRADRFDVKKAAERICRFFDEKKDLFGVEKLPRRITQNDLDEDDKDSLEAGSLYIHPGIDRTGRLVCFVATSRSRFKHIKNMLRANFYLNMAWLEDNEVSQRRGIVLLIYNIGNDQRWPISRSQASSISKLLDKALPLRVACYHHCHNNHGGEAAIAYLLSISAPFLKARYRQHYGSHRKVRSELIQYGFQVHLLPIDPRGGYDHDMLFATLKKLKKKELILQQKKHYDSTDIDDDDTADDGSLGSY